jgi:hypothetical protein
MISYEGYDYVSCDSDVNDLSVIDQDLYKSTSDVGYMSYFEFIFKRKGNFTVTCNKETNSINILSCFEEKSDITDQTLKLPLHFNIDIKLFESNNFQKLNYEMIFNDSPMTALNTTYEDNSELCSYEFHSFADKIERNKLKTFIENVKENKKSDIFCLFTHNYADTFDFQFDNDNNLFKLCLTVEQGDYDSPVEEYTITIDLAYEDNKTSILEQLAVMYEFIR